MKDEPPKKLNVKVIVFDWSGTLSDDAIPCYNAAMKMRAHFGMPSNVPFDQWKNKSSPNAVEFFRAYGFNEDSEKLIELFSKYYAESQDKPKAFDEAEGVLSFLKSKGKKIAVISAHPQEHLKKELVDYGFDKFITPASGGVSNKTEKLREFVEKLATRFGIKQSEIAYIGDTIWDVRAAKGAGICSIALLRGYHSEEMLRGENPDLVINSLDELKDHIA